ncbi:MAG: pyridoxamine 5'-phosphate oxidase family protein [Caryophanon sp.]|nr:pyridoxamine 5'-phosphate oxidase family protein [Caryophanon sp.]
MSTVSDGKPYARYMTFHNEGFTLYTVTSKDSDKVHDLLQNPYTHILYGYENNGLLEEFLEIEATVSEYDDATIKEQFLQHFKDAYFGDPSEMLVLKVTPTCIRMMNKAGDQQEDVPLV